MAYNPELLELSQNVIEKYVIQQMKHRPKVLTARHASLNEDMVLKIDGFVTNENGVESTLLIKTRTFDSHNFSLTMKDIRQEQPNRVFCFIDKTFDADTVHQMLLLDTLDAYIQLDDEHPKLLLVSLRLLLNDIGKFQCKDQTYYLIPKDYLNSLSCNS